MTQFLTQFALVPAILGLVSPFQAIIHRVAPERGVTLAHPARTDVAMTQTPTRLRSHGTNQARSTDEEFGPVVRAYLGYLRNEQEVVDDRASRHEVSQSYYRRNSNRIRALRQMAIKIARESRNDYLPELEAVARDEMGLLFERPPRPETLREGEILRRTFRFLGVVHSFEGFYVFARLDPYEQAELQEKGQEDPQIPVVDTSGSPGLVRAKRAAAP